MPQSLRIPKIKFQANPNMMDMQNLICNCSKCKPFLNLIKDQFGVCTCGIGHHFNCNYCDNLRKSED